MFLPGVHCSGRHGIRGSWRSTSSSKLSVGKLANAVTSIAVLIFRGSSERTIDTFFGAVIPTLTRPPWMVAAVVVVDEMNAEFDPRSSI